MKSKTSLFNKGVFIHNIKTYWWISLINFIILFFIMPFNHLNLLADLNIKNKKLYEKIAMESLQLKFYDSNSSKDSVQLFLIFAISVIVGTILFSYKNKKKSTTFYHSLPISKKSLFTTNVITGFFIIWLPIVVNSVVLILINVLTPLSQWYHVTDILLWTVFMIVACSVIYALTIFVGMFTGMTIANMLLTCIIYGIPYFIGITLGDLLSRYIYGFSHTGLDKILNYIPFYKFLFIEEAGFTLSSFLIMLLFTIIALIGSYYLYKRLPIESAGNLISFSPLRSAFKYCVTLCSVLLGSGVFIVLYNQNTIILIMGSILFSFLGYFITQALIDRTIKVGYAYKGYVGFVASMGILILLIFIDPFNYVSRVPALNEIAEVTIYRWNEDNGTSIKEEKNIENIINLHKDIINNKDKKFEYGYYSLNINYKLENGKNIKRAYDCIDIDNEYLQPLVDSYEYKIQNNRVLTKKIQDIETIEIEDERNKRVNYSIREKKQLQEIVEILKEDILNTSTHTKNKGNFFELQIEYKITSEEERHNKTEHFYIDNMKNVMDYIKEHDIYDDINVSAKDIEYVEIPSGKYDSSGNNEEILYKIKDKTLIQNIIEEGNSCTTYYRNKEEYFLVAASFVGRNYSDGSWVAIRKDSPIIKKIIQQNK